MTTDERLEKVEGQLSRVRWLNRCIIACVVLPLGVWLVCKSFGPKMPWARSGAKVLRANNFILEDEKGQPRAALALLEEGSLLVLCDENAKCRAELKVDKDGPILSLFDENLKPIWSAP